MTEHVLLVDVGSTFTKLAAVDERTGAVLATAAARTTIDSDVVDGYRDALAQLPTSLRQRAAWTGLCSSAAGGLRIVSCGLTARLSGQAAAIAALGSGAKVVLELDGALDATGLERIAAAQAHLILLSGGIDGGDTRTLVHNAAAVSRLTVAGVVVAGNSAARPEVVRAMATADLDVLFVENVLPRPGVLNIGPARDAVRDLFLRHITRAKGLAGLMEMLQTSCEPTPLAVSRGLQVVGDAIGETVLLVDLGGATTDVHSVGSPERARRGVDVAAPAVHRTVEGDMGMRWGAVGIVEAMADGDVAQSSTRLDRDLREEARRRTAEPGFLPVTGADAAVEATLAQAAVRIALERHAGRVVVRRNTWGDRYRVSGKNLTEAHLIFVTGGVFRHLPDHLPDLVTDAVAGSRESLLPRRAEVVVDEAYALYAVGLVAARDPDLARRMAGPLVPPPGSAPRLDHAHRYLNASGASPGH